MNTTPHCNEGITTEKDRDTADNSEFEIFDCPEIGCTKQFVKHGQLLNHLSTGKHTKHQEKIRLLDKAKLLYQSKLERSSIQQIPSLKTFVVTRSVQ